MSIAAVLYASMDSVVVIAVAYYTLHNYIFFLIVAPEG